MDMRGNPAERKLFDAFNRLRKLEWHKPSFEGHRPSELRVLLHIHRASEMNGGVGLTVSEISSKLEVTSPTVTQLIKGLESEGLVKRKNDQEDRRVVRVQLSDKGAQLANRAMEKFISDFQGLYDYLGEEESEQLVNLLGKVHKYLGQ